MQKIRIQRLGPIEDITIELKGVTVLLGEQAVGKSTIAQCVHFFRSLTEDIAAEMFQIRRGTELLDIREAIENTIRSKFYIYYGSSRYLDDFNIRFHYTDTSYIQIQKGTNTQVVFSEGFQIDSLCQRIHEHFDRTFPSPSRRADTLRNMMEEHFLRLPSSDFSRFEHDYYYPADRNIATMYSEQFRQIFLESYKATSLLTGQNVPQSVQNELTQEFMSRSVTMKEVFAQNGGTLEELLSANRIPQQFMDDFNERANYILKGKYIITADGTEKIKIKRGRHVELKRASSGQQSVIRILQDLAIINSKRLYTYRTIEEPEVHLFPAAQNQLTELMVMCHHLTNTEFLLTTHSPYFVATFNNLLYAAKAAQFDPGSVLSLGFPEHLRLNPNHFNAYMIKDGGAETIYQPEDALTNLTELDAVSLEVSEKFSQLADIVQTNEIITV